jgi:release factor glutamine methyltransferase
MGEQDKSEYTYRGVTVEVQPGVFQPNRTTEMLLDAVLKNDLTGKTALDLGCGSGVVGVMTKRFGRVARMFGSDISEKAVENASHNARKLGLDVMFRQGSVFEPWRGMQFDIIMNDISGVAEPIANLSPWYPPEIHCAAGLDGSVWTTKVLGEARKYLNPGGVVFFPTVSLSNEVKILEEARSRYARVECLLKKSWPFKEDFWQKITANETCRRLIDDGIVKVFQRGSRFLWDTSIYMACLSP